MYFTIKLKYYALSFYFIMQGLFKARNILNEDFGCVHIYIDEAISIRQFSNGHIDRVKHALEPR